FERGGQTGALDAVTRGEGEWEDLFVDMGLDVLKTFGVRTLRGLKQGDLEIEIKQGDVDDAIDAFEEAALQFARREAAQKIKNVTAGSKALINRIVTRTVDEGLGIPETTAAIQDELNGIHPRRARTIARTEVHNAQTQGQVESVRSLGRDDLEKGWLWSGVSRTEHKAMDSVWVGLNDQFDVPEADAPMDRPGDPAGGPQAVINCACTLVFRRRRRQGGIQQ
nr:hypothetical protein [Desulfuromonadales bacterium]